MQPRSTQAHGAADEAAALGKAEPVVIMHSGASIPTVGYGIGTAWYGRSGVNEELRDAIGKRSGACLPERKNPLSRLDLTALSQGY